MSEQFGHKYQLYIGRKKSLIESTQPKSVVVPNGEESQVASLKLLASDIEATNAVSQGAQQAGLGSSYQDFLVVPAQHILIEKLNMSANIVDTKAGTTSKSQTVITIKNLSKKNRDFIFTDDTVLLKAGYQTSKELPLVYAGQITKVEHTTEGVDTITRLTCGAAATVRKNVRFSKNPRRNESVKEVCEYFAGLAANNGIPTGRIFVPVDIKLHSGYPLEGNLFNEMEQFCDRFNLKAYVSLGKLYIEPIDSTGTNYLDTMSVLVIKSENIKGSIKPQQDSSGKNTSQKTSGIKFITFLDGRINTTKRVKIDFGDYRGEYTIVSVKFKMNYESRTWDTIVHCERIA